MVFGIFRKYGMHTEVSPEQKRNNRRTRSRWFFISVCVWVIFSLLINHWVCFSKVHTLRKAKWDRRRFNRRIQCLCEWKSRMQRAASYQYLFLCTQFIWPLRSYGMRNTYVMSFIFCVCSFPYFFIGNCCCCCWFYRCRCCCCCCCCWYVSLCSGAVMRDVCCCRFDICSSYYLSRSVVCCDYDFWFHTDYYFLCRYKNRVKKRSWLSKCLCACVQLIRQLKSINIAYTRSQKSFVCYFIIYCLLQQEQIIFQSLVFTRRNQLTLAVKRHIKSFLLSAYSWCNVSFTTIRIPHIQNKNYQRS